MRAFSFRFAFDVGPKTHMVIFAALLTLVLQVESYRLPLAEFWYNTTGYHSSLNTILLLKSCMVIHQHSLALLVLKLVPFLI